MKPIFDYCNIQPIANPIPPLKQQAKRHWGSHPYFTRRAWNVVQEYIRTFSQPGDVVLDPFGGSGVTAVEALVLHRRRIHEVETSTAITTGIDRFMELLNFSPNVAKNIVLIIPPKRFNKINKLLKDSHYIGHPLYMENKLMYCFTQKIAQLYNLLSQKIDLRLDVVVLELNSVLIHPEIY